jgi:hypothetical protein
MAKHNPISQWAHARTRVSKRKCLALASTVENVSNVSNPFSLPSADGVRPLCLAASGCRLISGVISVAQPARHVTAQLCVLEQLCVVGMRMGELLGPTVGGLALVFLF